MNKIPSKWKGFVLLLILLVAGWLVYNSFQKPEIFSDKRLPDPNQYTEKQLTINGIVEKYGSNHDGDIDKIVLSIKGQKVWLHFPPHA
ncbi:MAG: hypothetical protein ABIN24_13130, partial [Dyadobacter sp.]